MSEMNSQLPNQHGEDLETGLTPELQTELKNAQSQEQIDPVFQASLRSRLEQTARHAKIESPLIKEQAYMSWSKFFLGVGTSLVAVAIFWYVAGGQQFTSSKNAVEVLSSNYTVDEVEANSFGSLGNLATADAGGRGSGGDSASPASTSEVAVSAPNAASGSAGGYGGGGSDSKLIAPYPETNYTFKYKGSHLPGLEAQQSVFKRNKEGLGNPADSILGSIRVGLLNIQKLISPVVENLSISETRDRGYTANINFIEGSVSLYENWRTWRLPERECRDEACYNRYRMTPADMPSDEVIIATANQFLAEYSVNTSNYGQPIVQNYWLQEYERAADKSTIYIPDTVNVIYPYIVDGKAVFDEGGYPGGLNVSVNVRHNIVSSVYEITTQQYSKSNYLGFTDEEAIIDLAEKGGFRNYYSIYPAGSNVKKVVVELGTPSVGMMRLWQYNELFGTSEDLYVPSLIFPVTNKAESGYYRDNIIVPLVKEIIDSNEQPQPIPLDLPVSDGAAAE